MVSWSEFIVFISIVSEDGSRQIHALPNGGDIDCLGTFYEVYLRRKSRGYEQKYPHP